MFNGEKFSQVITHQGNLVRITGRLDSVEQLPPTGSYNQMYLIGAEDATRFEKYLWNVSTQHWDYKGVSVIMDWDDKQDLLVLHSSGTAEAQEITEPRIPELYEGLKLVIIPSANLSASPTLNINGLGAIPIKRRNNANGTLYAGARTGWLTAEHAYTLVYSNGNFIVTEFNKVSFTDTVGYKHDSTSTTYGAGSKTNYGHIKLVDDLEHSTYADGEALAASVGYKLKNLIGDLTTFDGKISVTNESFFESIPWEIADGVHKLVIDPSTGIPIGISVYKGILISASHTANVVKLVDTGNSINCYEKYITQTLIYTQSGEKTEIKTRNACITTLQDTGELYEETYGNWENAFATASYVDNAIFSAMESISPEQHAAVFRGKNLGSTITNAQKTAIADGSFKDLFIGDYWVINNITWRIADMDYWYNTSKNALTRHHLVMIPDTCLFEHIMKHSGSPDVPSTTNGGYHLTDMHREGMRKAQDIVIKAFGANMCVSHKEAFVNAVSNGRPSSFLFEDSWLDLPTEIMMYGTNIFSVASDGGTPPPAVLTYCRTQLALFDIAPKFIVSPRQTYWLRDIVSEGQYAAVNAGGYATHSGSEFSLGVRPVFCIG